MPSSPFTPQLRPLSIGEVLDAGFRLVRHRLGTLVLCVLAPVLPLTALRTIIIASTNPDYYDVNAIVTEESDTGAVVGWWVAGLVLAVGAVVAVAACFKVISAAYLGEKVSPGASLRAGLGRLPALFISSLIIGVVLLFLAGTATAIYVTALAVAYLAVKWSVSSPAIVAERLGPFRGMRRSWHLTKKNWWRTLAVLLVVLLITIVLWLAIVVSITAGLSTLDSISELSLATLDTLFYVIVLSLIYPFTAAILTVLYYDMRVRNEGFDLQLLAAGVGADTSRFEAAPERPQATPPPELSPAPAGSASGGFAPPEEPSSAS